MFLDCIKETTTKMMCSYGFDTWKKLSTHPRLCMKTQRNYSKLRKLLVTWNKGAQSILLLFMKKMDKIQLSKQEVSANRKLFNLA